MNLLYLLVIPLHLLCPIPLPHEYSFLPPYHTEIERVHESMAELEGERTKRRRLEREKKFFETETHRLKTQLTVTSSGGTSGDQCLSFLPSWFPHFLISTLLTS